MINKGFYILSYNLAEFHLLVTLPHVKVVRLLVMSWRLVSPSVRPVIFWQSVRRKGSDGTRRTIDYSKWCQNWKLSWPRWNLNDSYFWPENARYVKNLPWRLQENISRHQALFVFMYHPGWLYGKRAERTRRMKIGWRGVWGFLCQLGSASIGSSSPVSRSSSSSNKTRFFSSVLACLALLVRVWLGLAADHRPHTPTTTPFHWRPRCDGQS